jgi:hypothetical protein
MEIFQILTNTSLETGTNWENTRISSLQTLGFIAQEITEDNLTQEDSNSILGAIVQNILQLEPVELVSQALQAFLYFISFIRRNIMLQNERDTILKSLIDTMNNQNIQIRVLAMQGIVEIVRFYYDYLSEQNTKDIIQVTFHTVIILIICR